MKQLRHGAADGPRDLHNVDTWFIRGCTDSRIHRLGHQFTRM